jgi:hypothetical protein
VLVLQAKAGITDDIVKAMTDCSMKLSKGRKQRAPPPELASAEELATYQLLGSQPLHKTGKVPSWQNFADERCNVRLLLEYILCISP